MTQLETALAENSMIAILRGLSADKAIDVAVTLVAAGFRIIEVPLNSPNALKSIEAIADRCGDEIIVGAGTVLSAQAVEDVANAGGRIIVSPNMDPQVGSAAKSRKLFWCPGVMTPTEAFSALGHGASVLKFFPAEMVPPNAISAMRAVLPRDARVAAVGGITPDTMAEYASAGADCFGLGSALFKPSFSLDDIARRAHDFVEAFAILRASK